MAEPMKMGANDTTITLIEPVIDQSLDLLRGRAGAEDIAHGVLVALRRVRATLEEMGGYAPLSTLDTAIRHRLIIRQLRSRRAGELTRTVPLPRPGAQGQLTETVMLASVETCLVYALREPDLCGLFVVVFVLVDRLVEAMGDLPDHGDLAIALRATDDSLLDEMPRIDGEIRESVH